MRAETGLKPSARACAADNPVDDQLMTDLEAMVERTKGEIERLTAHLAKPTS